MSDSDSFINEVTEEVRREKLYGYLRRYGWIAVAAVLILVGGAAFNEYRSAQSRAQAEATGDALLAALTLDDEAQRAQALAAIDSAGPSSAVALLLQASAEQATGDAEAAAATLNAVATNPEVPELYRDLAAFKAALLPVGDVAARKDTLEALAAPGRPYSLLAQEQLAYIALEEGDTDAAMAILRRIDEDAAVTRGLRERARMLMVALGEPLPDAVNQ